MAKQKNNKNHKTKAPKYTTTQKVMLAVVILAMVTVAVGVILSIFFRPEPLTKSRISALATDYYENYIYDSLIKSDKFNGDLESTMSDYQAKGFSPITLRQLILHDQTKTSSYADELTRYCNDELTDVVFYPDPPYSRTDYHIEYNYVCNF